MFQKKFAAFLLTAMVTAAVSIPVLASTSETAPAASTSTNYPVCTDEGCSKTYDHTHDGTWYEGHHAEDGSNCTSSSTCTGKHSGTHHTNTTQSQTHHSQSHHTGTQAQDSTATQTTKTTSGHSHHSHSGSHH